MGFSIWGFGSGGGTQLFSSAEAGGDAEGLSTGTDHDDACEPGDGAAWRSLRVRDGSCVVATSDSSRTGSIGSQGGRPRTFFEGLDGRGMAGRSTLPLSTQSGIRNQEPG